MTNIHSFNAYIEKSIKDHWDRDALTDFEGATLQYHDVARKMEKLHILFESCQVRKGDKIAICGRNSNEWAVTFLAVLTYGAVVVPIQHEFTADQVHNIVNHSEARLLFVGDIMAKHINGEAMPHLQGIINMAEDTLVISRSDMLDYAHDHLNQLYGKRYPKFFRKQHVSYHEDEPEELAMINYTSGTTGFSKGVMVPYRALWGNIDFLLEELAPRLPKEATTLSILPMAHMYGLTFEFLFQFIVGSHIYFLNRVPSPSLIQEACALLKPDVMISVPAVVEKIVRKKILPKVEDNRVKVLMAMPVISKKVKENICNRTINIFGSEFYELVIGGAALNKDIESFLVDIGFPLTAGYGTTETAPLITYSDKHDYVPRSCGTVVKHMEVKIDSDDPENIPGEILTRGMNLMLGYYKDEEATRKVIDEQGWFHTGDLGTMSNDGHVFIKGRIKNMLLTANGQNVYPEEIESRLNSMAMVSESLVVQRGEKLIGLVHPDMEEAHMLGFDNNDLNNVMEQNRLQLNAQLPSFCRITEIKIHDKEFEKTPKRSIKRFLYQNAV